MTRESFASLRTRLTTELAPEQLQQLQAAMIEVSNPNNPVTATSRFTSWFHYVAIIEDGREILIEEVINYLMIRDYIEAAMRLLSVTTREPVHAIVNDADRRYLDATTADDGEFFGRYFGIPDDRDLWWWRRRPHDVSGLVGEPYP